MVLSSGSSSPTYTNYSDDDDESNYSKAASSKPRKEYSFFGIYFYAEI